VKGGVRYPIHGGPHALGVFNAITAAWNPNPGPSAGYTDIVHGSSFVMAAHFVDPDTNGGCGVDADAIVTYSQSEDVTRPWFANQTRMYGEHEWNPMYFCEAELAADPDLVTTRVRSDDADGSAIARAAAAATGGTGAGAADADTDRSPARGPLPLTGAPVAVPVALAAWLLATGLHLRTRATATRRR
jgi:acyl-homoserine-lactone acylase